MARILAERFGTYVYDGDRAELGWVARCTPDRHPYLCAMARLADEQRSQLTPEDQFNGMASLHGETVEFLVEDLLALPADRLVLVDYFGIAPRDLAPLLTWREQAVFVLPTPEFRRRVLGIRFADPDRARVNWGDGDHTRAFANRLARDELWDAELRRQAAAADLPVLAVDGTRDAAELADDLARRFRLVDDRNGQGV
ncbi:hypothetical protein [Streptoalloteichus hindustanus]|uniref:Thymidylate kinase n=1 Tax=Streptoalloteichus hindustanus TaxID=2017 RepID=A0A1M5PXM1_STRHI|nr:hypothetical protein [Streptoalloteichus hindustanus]SHH06281.1 hypothetical protein SAMN05444320_12031 [Streptoalloteichus hindustanus]